MYQNIQQTSAPFTLLSESENSFDFNKKYFLPLSTLLVVSVSSRLKSPLVQIPWISPTMVTLKLLFSFYTWKEPEWEEKKNLHGEEIKKYAVILKNIFFFVKTKKKSVMIFQW